MPALVTLNGSTLAAPNDGLARSTPPKPPNHQPAPAPSPTPPTVDLDSLVDKKYAGQTAVEPAAAPLDALNGLSTAEAAQLAQALSVTTIGQLANHPLIQAAQTIQSNAPA